MLDLCVTHNHILLLSEIWITLAIAHFCYDWAQNVPVPYSPQQISPLYFKSVCSVSIFRINDTGNQPQSLQTNYIIDEGASKGANMTLSLVYDTLTKHNRGEKSLNMGGNTWTQSH